MDVRGTSLFTVTTGGKQLGLDSNKVQIKFNVVVRVLALIPTIWTNSDKVSMPLTNG